MAIIKKNIKNEDPEISSSKNVGKANSKAVKKREKTGSMDGIVLQLDKNGKPVAPKANQKKGKKELADMIADAKKR